MPSAPLSARRTRNVAFPRFHAHAYDRVETHAMGRGAPARDGPLSTSASRRTPDAAGSTHLVACSPAEVDPLATLPARVRLIAFLPGTGMPWTCRECTMILPWGQTTRSRESRTRSAPVTLLVVLGGPGLGQLLWARVSCPCP